MASVARKDSRASREFRKNDTLHQAACRQVESSLSQGFHLVEIQRFQRPDADACAVGRGLHHAMSLQVRPWGASIAPSFPSFEDSSALSKRLYEKSRDPCWDKSCRLEGSSEQLFSLAIHLDVEFNLVAETEGCQLT